METDTFKFIWELLAPQGEFIRRKEACQRLWAEFTLDKQHDVYRRIRDKKRRGEFVNVNPYYAIADNEYAPQTPSTPAQPPTNYNRSRDFDRMVATGTLVTAEYNGEVGIYTEADATRYHMTILKHLQP